MLKFLLRVTLLAFLSLPSFAAELLPMKQGLHEWAVPGGKLMLVVGTYQDTIHFKRTYTFYFKKRADEDWNQVLFAGKNKDGFRSTWESASGGEVTLADGLVVARGTRLYFVVGEKELKGSYYDKGTIWATWYQFATSGDDEPDGPFYQLKPVYTRRYPNTGLEVEDILARESLLEPKR